MSLGINSIYSNQLPQQTQGLDPDSFAQQYATKNGISVEEAKSELASLYGEPTQANQDTTSIFSDSSSMQDDYSGQQNISEQLSQIIANSPYEQDGPQKEGDPDFQQFNLIS